MKRGPLFIIACLLTLTLLLMAAYSQDDMEFVDNSVFDKPELVPSIFRHEEHNEKAGLDACEECHHVYEDGQRLEGESSEDQRCAECHEAEAVGRQPGLMKAYHLNCKGCHQAGKLGPLMCGECHRR